MSLTIQRSQLSKSTNRVQKSKFKGIQFLTIGQDDDATDMFDDDNHPYPEVTAVERALEDFEEFYLRLLESVNVDTFERKYINRYIKRAENRRGAAFTKAERERFRDMAKSDNPEMLRLLALELRIGIPRRVERDALAALGNLMLYRDQDGAFKSFLSRPNKDPNLLAIVKTVSMTGQVEDWMGKVQELKERFVRFTNFGQSRTQVKQKASAAKAAKADSDSDTTPPAIAAGDVKATGKTAPVKKADAKKATTKK